MNNKKKSILSYLIFCAVWVFGLDAVFIFLEINNLFIFQIKEIIFALITLIFVYYLILKKEDYVSVKEEKQKLETLINSMVDFVNFKDGKGRWTRANEFALKLFQIEHADYIGKKDSELTVYNPFYKEAFEYCETSDEEAWKAGGVTRCIEIIPMPDGSEKTFDAIKIPTFNSDGSRCELMVVGRDITDRVSAEKRLEESEQRYKSLFEFNPEMVFMIDLKGNLTNANSNFTPLTEYKIEEFINKSLTALIPKSEREKLEKLFYQGWWKNIETEIITKSNKRKIVRSTGMPMIINEKLVGIIGYAMDISKEKETEQFLRKSEKLSIVGELAASVAHEIRNPLTSLKGFVQLLMKSDPSNYYYQIMLDELDRINQISSELLVLAKPEVVKFEKFELLIILNSVKSLLEPQLNFENVELNIDNKQDLPPIDCIPNQLKQLFINIIKNSIEASAKKINLSIIEEERYIIIQITDDGIGIDAERLNHLGEPFYSSKEKGTGLGLTVSHRIVNSHKGKIKYESEIGVGTKVSIYLPI